MSTEAADASMETVDGSRLVRENPLNINSFLQFLSKHCTQQWGCSFRLAGLEPLPAIDDDDGEGDDDDCEGDEDDDTGVIFPFHRRLKVAETRLLDNLSFHCIYNIADGL